MLIKINSERRYQVRDPFVVGMVSEHKEKTESLRKLQFGGEFSHLLYLEFEAFSSEHDLNTMPFKMPEVPGGVFQDSLYFPVGIGRFVVK